MPQIQFSEQADTISIDYVETGGAGVSFPIARFKKGIVSVTALGREEIMLNTQTFQRKLRWANITDESGDAIGNTQAEVMEAIVELCNITA